MRILIISNLYPPNVIGGYERLCFEVATGLAEKGHAITVLTSNHGGKVASYPGQTVRRDLRLLVGPDIYSPFQGSPENRAAIARHNLAVVAQVLDEVSPDIVYAWNLFFFDESLLEMLEQSRFRTVVMLTDNWLLVMRNPQFVADFFRDVVFGPKPFVPPRASLTQRAMRRLGPLFGRKSGGLEAVFGSNFMRDYYELGGIRFGRRRVVHNGVRNLGDAGRVPRDRRRLVDPDVLHLLFVGRLVDLKGVHTAVEALPSLDPATLGVRRIHLTLVGDAQDATYLARLTTLIAESPCRAEIEIRPPVPEETLFDLFDAHDIYLFPSLYEPFSLTLIHAMASGIPTIASLAGGNPELLRDGEGGLLFEKGNPLDLARAIRSLAADPALRQRLASAGCVAARRFGFDRMIEETVGFLAEPP